MPDYRKIIHYLFFGSLGFISNATIFFILDEVMKIWYVLSACISFAISVMISFYLQGTWTFRGEKAHPVKHQMLAFYSLSFVNVLINGAFVYLIVETFHPPHLAAVVVSSGVIAIYSFFLYKNFIFKTTPNVA